MNTTMLDVDKAPLWEEFVRSHPDTVAWQSYRWNEVLQKQYDVTFFPIVAYDKGRICGILPLYYIRTSARHGRLVSVPHAVAGGITASDPDAASALLNRADALRKRRGQCPVTFKQYKVRIEAALLTDANYYNRELALTKDSGAAFDGFADENKRAIESAERLGVRIQYPSLDVDAFYEILLTHHLRKGLPCVGKQWIRGLVSSGMYSIAHAHLDESLVAATMVKRFKNTVSFPFTCALDDAHEHAATYCLYWKLIEHFAREGVEIFHSGRIPNNNDTDAYRLGWGGEMYGYFYQYLTDATVRTEYTAKRGKKRNLGQAVWKRLPRQVARVLGPRVVRRYP